MLTNLESSDPKNYFGKGKNSIIDKNQAMLL